MIDWISDCWLIDWLIEWKFGCWLIDWLIDWLTSWAGFCLGIKACFCGHYHRNAGGKAGPKGELDVVVTTAIGLTLEEDATGELVASSAPSGMRVVRVLDDKIAHEFHPLDDFPTDVEFHWTKRSIQSLLDGGPCMFPSSQCWKDTISAFSRSFLLRCVNALMPPCSHGFIIALLCDFDFNFH